MYQETWGRGFKGNRWTPRTSTPAANDSSPPRPHFIVLPKQFYQLDNQEFKSMSLWRPFSFRSAHYVARDLPVTSCLWPFLVACSRGHSLQLICGLLTGPSAARQQRLDRASFLEVLPCRLPRPAPPCLAITSINPPCLSIILVMELLWVEKSSLPVSLS